jgi:hypothetical protein
VLFAAAQAALEFATWSSHTPVQRALALRMQVSLQVPRLGLVLNACTVLDCTVLYCKPLDTVHGSDQQGCSTGRGGGSSGFRVTLSRVSDTSLLL